MALKLSPKAVILSEFPLPMVNSCAGQDRPWFLSEPFNNTLTSAVLNAFNGTVLNNEAALYCAVDSKQCLGICPNADVTGVGVRVAFYLNSLLTALLVGLSPEDSPSAAWSSAVLTISLVIPAVIQKKQQALTLYHATLVLNFATFSSVSSLAVAPLCTVWRVIDNKDHPKHTTRLLQFSYSPKIPLPNLSPDHHGDDDDPRSIPSPNPMNDTTAPERQRSRMILSFALIAQVSLQWAWATYLFTSPYYAQTACSPQTNVVLFGATMLASKINTDYFGLWAGWLLFSILVTLVFGVLLVISSTSGVNANKRPMKQLRPPKVSWVGEKVRKWDPKGDKRRLGIFSVAFVICTALVVFSEMQANANCVFGENTQWGFGQLAALLFALAPLWAIVQSQRGQAIAQKVSHWFRKNDGEARARDPLDDIYRGHFRDHSREALLIGGERSPQSSPSHSRIPSDPDSPIDLRPISPGGMNITPFSLSPSSSTNRLSPVTPSPPHTIMRRHRSRSRSNEILTMDDIIFQLTPPTRPHSRANHPEEDFGGDEYSWSPVSPLVGGLGQANIGRV